MRQLGLALAGVAALAFAAVGQPAHAVPVDPNGSLSFSAHSGVITTNTGNNITATTTSLTLPAGSGSIMSFIDPYGTVVNNFCGAAGDGCTAAHAPGFLVAGDLAIFTDSLLNPNTTFNFSDVVGGIQAISKDITLESAADHSIWIRFAFTSIETVSLLPSGTRTPGFLNLALTGTFSDESPSLGSSYNLGGAAGLSLTCTQSSTGSAIGCTMSVASPPFIPEPATLAILGSGLLGLAWARRRRRG